ncbi:MAG: hypothetical protein DHS80DRAFT_23109 [Piptocephalis tieghemiana]|nr:MAG: hypothetical protein DHS80DRAFT_23109 [Piptocephalis tieghemiana]
MDLGGFLTSLLLYQLTNWRAQETADLVSKLLDALVVLGTIVTTTQLYSIWMRSMRDVEDEDARQLIRRFQWTPQVYAPTLGITTACCMCILGIEYAMGYSPYTFLAFEILHVLVNILSFVQMGATIIVLHPVPDTPHLIQKKRQLYLLTALTLFWPTPIIFPLSHPTAAVILWGVFGLLLCIPVSLEKFDMLPYLKAESGRVTGSSVGGNYAPSPPPPSLPPPPPMRVASTHGGSMGSSYAAPSPISYSGSSRPSTGMPVGSGTGQGASTSVYPPPPPSLRTGSGSTSTNGSSGGMNGPGYNPRHPLPPQSYYSPQSYHPSRPSIPGPSMSSSPYPGPLSGASPSRPSPPPPRPSYTPSTVSSSSSSSPSTRPAMGNQGMGSYPPPPPPIRQMTGTPPGSEASNQPYPPRTPFPEPEFPPPIQRPTHGSR